MKTIKQNLSELPEPYNWLALESAHKWRLDSKLDYKYQSEAFYFGVYWSNGVLDFDFFAAIYDNLKHLGK